MNYPATINGVITVGAINRNGNIWNYSSRGPEMDLVAPSGDVGGNGDLVTTDRMGILGYDPGNYTFTFGGTSAAAPQVSGVAALMLSVNPNLTEAQVRTILQQTATDMGPTGFDNTFGFGRVNAHAAMQAALPISGPDFLCASETYTISNVPAGATVTWSAAPSGAVSFSRSGNSRTVTWSGAHLGEVTLTAMVTTDCGTAEISKVISVGGIPQNELTVIGDRLVCYGNYLYTVQYFGHMPITGYQWHLPPGYSATVTNPISAPNQWMISIPPYEMFPQTMELFVQTPCGNQGPWMIELWEQSPGCASPFIFSVYPSPADDEFSVVGNMEFQSAQHEKAIVHPAFSATLFDQNGNPKLEKNSVDGQILFKTGQLPAGVYVLHIRHNGNKEERQILIRH